MQVPMKSLRTFTLNSTRGHSVRFVANETTQVPEALVQEAMGLGCVPMDTADIPFIDQIDRSRIDFPAPLRQSLIWMTMEVLVKENNQKNFTGGGVPRAEVISDRLGFSVPQETVAATWQDYLTAKNQDLNIAPHPDAASVMAVLAAEDIQTLKALAVSFGVPVKKLDGLTSSDIRKTLLAKFNAAQVGQG